MKKSVIAVLAAFLISVSSICYAAWLIQLKDGREVMTHKYWEEGDQIKIERYGGVIGISKDDVISIEEADAEQEKRPVLVIKSEPKTDKKEKAEEPAEPEEKKALEKKEESDVENKKEPEKPASKKPSKEKNAFLKEFDALKKQFKKVDSMTNSEIIQFDKELMALKNKIIKAGLAGPYADHLVEILNMGSRAEEILNRRGQ